MLRKVYVADVSTFLYAYTHMFPTLYWIFNRIRWYHGIASTIFYNNEKNKIKYSKEITKETYRRNWLIKELPGIHTHHAIQRERIHVRNILHRSVANPLGTGVEQQIWWTWHDITATYLHLQIKPKYRQTALSENPRRMIINPTCLLWDSRMTISITLFEHHHATTTTRPPTDPQIKAKI